VVEETNAH